MNIDHIHDLKKIMRSRFTVTWIENVRPDKKSNKFMTTWLEKIGPVKKNEIKILGYINWIIGHITWNFWFDKNNLWNQEF